MKSTEEKKGREKGQPSMNTVQRAGHRRGEKTHTSFGGKLRSEKKEQKREGN